MRNLQKISLRSTHAFTDFFLKYIEQDASLRPFYSRFPEVANFEDQIKEKLSGYKDSSRKVLVETLRHQYQNIKPIPEAVEKNIGALLDKNTCTITTGHQLNIFTGPLYFIYKIITVINACQTLQARFPKYRFVPIYWMASEDHDYEEIKSFRLNGSAYTWETDQKGAVGRFDPAAIGKIIDQLPGDVSIFKDAYLKNRSLSDAVRSYVTKLFGTSGLVVLDADSRALKEQFRPVIHDDLFEHWPFKHVSKTNETLASLGFTAQVNPREINHFYLDQHLRARIEERKNGFSVVDTNISFTRKELEGILEKEPEKFSPNVILRPLYQEMILPNLAYVGGPAELLYWLQLKAMFDHYHVPFPILLPRNFALIVDGPTGRKLSKTGLDVTAFFEEKNYVFKQWVSKNSGHDLSLGTTMKEVSRLFEEIRERCERIDTTLAPMTQAETKRVQGVIEKIEKKMLRAEKRKQGDSLRQIESVKDKLFPGGGLQERTDNFLSFYLEDPSFLTKLAGQLDPFSFQFNVLGYHD